MTTPQKRYSHASPGVQRGFTMYPNAVILDTSLSIESRFLYGLFKHFAWLADEEGPEQDEIAALLCLSENTLRKYIKELTKAGLLVSIRRGQGRSNGYQVVEPDEVQNLRNCGSGTSEIEVSRYKEEDSSNTEREPNGSLVPKRHRNGGDLAKKDSIGDVTDKFLILLDDKVNSGYGYDLYEEFMKVWDPCMEEAEAAGLRKNTVGIRLAGAFVQALIGEERSVDWSLVGRLVRFYGKVSIYGLRESYMRAIDEGLDESGWFKYAQVVCKEYKKNLETRR